MPRGMILLSSSASRAKVESCLVDLQSDISFVSETHATIEAWCPTLGNADYALRVFGLSLESIRLASARIREAVSAIEPAAPGRVVTCTIVGSSIIDMQSPSGASALVSTLRSRFKPLASEIAMAELASGEPSNDIESAATAAVVIVASITDTIMSLQRSINSVMDGRPHLNARLADASNAIAECRRRLIETASVPNREAAP